MAFESFQQFPSVDNELVDKIVNKLKSQGIFDQFRKDCLADVDTKPAYQNLQQRVNGTVSGFLANHKWQHDLNKTQLRESLRRHVQQGYLEVGVDRIVDQVVNPKIYSVFMPKVEDMVYDSLGIEKPKRVERVKPIIGTLLAPKLSPPPPPVVVVVKPPSPADLLPKDLDPVSPGSVVNDEDDSNTIDVTQALLASSKKNTKKEEDSPSFELLLGNEASNNSSKLSGMSELSSHGSLPEASSGTSSLLPKSSSKPPAKFDNFSNLSEKIKQLDTIEGRVKKENSPTNLSESIKEIKSEVIDEDSSASILHPCIDSDSNGFSLLEDQKSDIYKQLMSEDSRSSMCNIKKDIIRRRSTSMKDGSEAKIKCEDFESRDVKHDSSSEGKHELDDLTVNNDSNLESKSRHSKTDKDSKSRKYHDKDKIESNCKDRKEKDDKRDASRSKSEYSNKDRNELSSKPRKDSDKSEKDKKEFSRNKSSRYNSSRNHDSKHRSSDKKDDKDKSKDDKDKSKDDKYKSSKDRHSNGEKIDKDSKKEDDSKSHEKDRKEREHKSRNKEDEKLRTSSSSTREKSSHLEPSKKEHKSDEKERHRKSSTSDKGKYKSSSDKSKTDDKRKEKDDEKKKDEERKRSKEEDRKKPKEDDRKRERDDERRKDKDEDKKREKTDDKKKDEERRKERESRKRKGERCLDVKLKESRRSSDRDNSGNGGSGSGRKSTQGDVKGSTTSDKGSVSKSDETITNGSDVVDGAEELSEVDLILMKINSSIEEESAGASPPSIRFVRKPKIAKNMQEVKKIMHARRSFERKAKKEMKKEDDKDILKFVDYNQDVLFDNSRVIKMTSETMYASESKSNESKLDSKTFDVLENENTGDVNLYQVTKQEEEENTANSDDGINSILYIKKENQFKEEDVKKTVSENCQSASENVLFDDAKNNNKEILEDNFVDSSFLIKLGQSVNNTSDSFDSKESDGNINYSTTNKFIRSNDTIDSPDKSENVEVCKNKISDIYNDDSIQFCGFDNHESQDLEPETVGFFMGFTTEDLEKAVSQFNTLKRLIEDFKKISGQQNHWSEDELDDNLNSLRSSGKRKRSCKVSVSPLKSQQTTTTTGQNGYVTVVNYSPIHSENEDLVDSYQNNIVHSRTKNPFVQSPLSVCLSCNSKQNTHCFQSPENNLSTAESSFSDSPSKPLSTSLTEAMLDNLLKESNIASWQYDVDNREESSSSDTPNSPAKVKKLRRSQPTEADGENKTKNFKTGKSVNSVSPEKRRRTTRSSLRSQRYDSSDLYKPRLTHNSRRVRPTRGESADSSLPHMQLPEPEPRHLR